MSGAGDLLGPEGTAVPSATIRCLRWEGLALCRSPPRGWTRTVRFQRRFWRELPPLVLMIRAGVGSETLRGCGLRFTGGRGECGLDRWWSGWLTCCPAGSQALEAGLGGGVDLTWVPEVRGLGTRAGLEAFEHRFSFWGVKAVEQGLRENTGILHGSVIPQRVTRSGLYLVIHDDLVRHVKGPRPRQSALPVGCPPSAASPVWPYTGRELD